MGEKNMFKRFLKIFGIVLGVLVGVMGLAVGVYAIIGGFNQTKIGMTNVFFDSETETERKLIVENDVNVTINYLPTDATETKLKTIVSGDTNIIDIPSTVTGGQEFTIKLRKTLTGRNIGGNVTIEFVSADKNSESNLISPCKLQLTVDVPVENNDLFFASDLRYISSSSSLNQRIIAKNQASTDFYLRSNKSNIFDINQWSRTENKETYFYYEENGVIVPLTIDDTALKVVSCTYDKTKDWYKLTFYPDRTNENVLKVISKVHRSYEIQSEYKSNGFSQLEEYVLGNISLSESDISGLLVRYNEFLDKYYKDYFAKGNSTALKFFDDNSTNGHVMLSSTDSEILKKIKTSLDYVFASTSIEFYISDVKVRSFTVTGSEVDLSLVKRDSMTGELDRTETYYVENASTGANYIASKFGINIQGTNLSGGGAISNEAKLDLINQITIDVLVFDNSGKSKIVDKNFVVNANTDYNYKADIENYKTKDDYKGKFGTNNQYLTVTKSDQKINGNYTWTFEKLVPSKSGEFQIYLMFTLGVDDEDGHKTFYDFVKVKISEDSDTSEDGLAKNNNINFGVDQDSSNTIYVSNDETIKSELMGKGYTPNTKSVSTYGNYSNVTFRNFKVFAYLGSGNDNGSIANYGNNSVMTKSSFSTEEAKKLYSVLDIKPDRICTFTNLDGKILQSIINEGKMSTSFVTQTQNTNVVYAYELFYEDIAQINSRELTRRVYTIDAVNASTNDIVLFGCYVLTDKDDNPINREGVRLYLGKDGGHVVEGDANNNKPAYKEYNSSLNEYNATNTDGIVFDKINVNGSEATIVNYIALNDITIQSNNMFKVKSVLEKLYYYTQIESDITITNNGKDTKYTAKSLIQRNDNLNIFGALKLLKGQTYNKLTVLPYDIKDLDNLTADGMHEKLTNSLLALNDAIQYSSLTGFNFEIRLNNTTLTDCVKVTSVNKDKLDGEQYNNTVYHPIIITLVAETIPQGDQVPYIIASNSELANSLYMPNDAVRLEVNDIAITGYGKMYNVDGELYVSDVKDEDTEVINNFDYIGKINSNDDRLWVTAGTPLFGKYKMLYLCDFSESSKFTKSLYKNFSTNITSGLEVDSNVFKFVADNANLDISMVSSNYIDEMICRYIFAYDGDWKNIDTLYTELKTRMAGNVNPTAKTYNEIYNLSNVSFTTEHTSCAEANVYVDVTAMYKLEEDNYQIRYYNKDGNEELCLFSNDQFATSLNASRLEKEYRYITNSKDGVVELRYIKTDENNTTDILIATIITDYAKYFTNGMEIEDGYRVKLDESGNLPLADQQGHYGILFKVKLTFNGDNSKIFDYYFTTDAKFQSPTFVLKDPVTGNPNLARYTIQGGTREFDFSDKFKAYYNSNKETELNSKIKFTIKEHNYAYFKLNEVKTDIMVGTSNKLFVYDCFEQRTVTVISELAGKKLTIELTIEPSVTKTITLTSNSKFYNYVNNANVIYNTANKKITIANNNTELEPATSFEIDGNYIIYDLSKLFSINGKTNYGIECTSASYIDLNGNTQSLSKDTVIANNEKEKLFKFVDVFVDVNKKHKGQKLHIHSDIFTTLVINFRLDISDSGYNFSPVEDVANMNYQVTIQPIVKVVKSNKLISNNTYYQYQQSSNILELLENGANLFDIISTQVLTKNSATDVLEYTADSNFVFGKFDKFEIMDNYNYQFAFNNKSYITRKQFVDTNGNRNQLGDIVYGSTSMINITDGKLSVKAIDKSIILPISYSIDNGFLGISNSRTTNSVELLVPIAGYVIYNDKTGKTYGYDYETKKYETISLDLSANGIYNMPDYLSLQYASLELVYETNSSLTTDVVLPQQAINNGTEILRYGVVADQLDQTSGTTTKVIDTSDQDQDIMINGVKYGTLIGNQQLSLRDYYNNMLSTSFEIYIFQYKIMTTGTSGNVARKVDINAYTSNASDTIGGIAVTINIVPSLQTAWSGVGVVVNSDMFKTTGIDVAGSDVATWLTNYLVFVQNNTNVTYQGGLYAVEYKVIEETNTCTVTFVEKDKDGNTISGNQIEVRFNSVIFDATGAFANHFADTTMVISISDHTGRQMIVQSGIIVNGR